MVATNAARRLGVCTGGGDCPGLNAVLRAIAIRGEQLGIEVVGIEDGFDGLLAGTDATTRSLQRRDVAHILDLGGTILGTTSRGNPFEYPAPDGTASDRSAEVIARARELDLSAIIAIGGDGTQSIALELERAGLAMIGVPKTIDNDLAPTYQSFGFATAVQVATDALDRLRTTAESHERVMILEVMGRNAGWIALHTGISGGANAMLIPEIPYDAKVVAEALRQRKQRGFPFGLLVVAEGARPRGEEAPEKQVVGPTAGHAKILGGAGQRAAELISMELPDVEFRVMVLGHVQRGGTPVAPDRILATRLGVAAVDVADRGEHGLLVSWQPPDVVAVPLSDVVTRPRLVDPAAQIVAHARGAGISLGA